MKIRIYWLVFNTIAIGALLVLLLRFGAFDFLKETTPQVYVYGGTAPIAVTIADTKALREQGLSGTATLPRNTGMWFVFDNAEKYGFWMKDMNYPIDIIWIDNEYRVVGIAEAVSPASYPQVVYPPTPVRYVLEINANETAKNNIRVGTTVSIGK